MTGRLTPNWWWVKNWYPKWNPGKWNQGLKPAVPWWLNFDPYPIHDSGCVHLACACSLSKPGTRVQSLDCSPTNASLRSTLHFPRKTASIHCFPNPQASFVAPDRCSGHVQGWQTSHVPKACTRLLSLGMVQSAPHPLAWATGTVKQDEADQQI